MKKSYLFFVYIIFFAISNYALDSLDYSEDPPRGFSIENVPCFVIIGADDIEEPDGVTWLVDFLSGKTNPTGHSQAETFDGTPVLMSFYVNGKYALNNGAYWKLAQDSGHEIANHTQNHSMGGRTRSKELWALEIKTTDSILASIGIDTSKVIGFRTPFLEYNDSAFMAMTERGFVYDCSIEEGVEANQNGKNYYWPFTLDNGSQADELLLSWYDPVEFPYASCGKSKGLWEIPVYNYIIPPDGAASKYGFKFGLRNRVKKNIPWFSTSDGKITAFDYNLMSPAADNGAALDSIEYLATLCYSLDCRLSGNRAPFTIGMHSDFYTSAYSVENTPNLTETGRRWVIEEFINYALTKPEVRIVRASDLITWMRNPVAFPTPIINTKFASQYSLLSYSIKNRTLSFTLNKTCNISISLYTLSGKKIHQLEHGTRASGSYNTKIPKMSNGTFLLQFSTDEINIAKKIVIIDK